VTKITNRQRWTLENAPYTYATRTTTGKDPQHGDVLSVASSCNTILEKRREMKCNNSVPATAAPKRARIIRGDYEAVFLDTLTAYLDARQTLDEAALTTSSPDEDAQRPVNRFRLVEYVTDIERATHDAIDQVCDAPELRKALTAFLDGLEHDKPATLAPAQRARVIQICGSIYAERKLAPSLYFRTVRTRRGGAR
jgi:hypothetical protein